MNEPVLKKSDPPEDTMATMRARFDEVESFIKSSRRHQNHRRKYPGRLEALLDEADRYLQQAEWTMGALNDDGRFSDKLHDLAFKQSLRLAHKTMLLAVLDQPVMLGEQISRERSKGVEAINKARQSTDRIGPLIEMLAKMRDGWGDDLEANELWPELYGNMDVAGLRPREVGEGMEKRYDYDGGYITYVNFRKKLERARKS